MEMEMQRHERLQAAGPEFPLQLRSRGYNLNGPTEEQDEASIRPPPGSSIASLLSLIGSLGQAVDEHESCWVTSSRVRVSQVPSRKYPISLLLQPKSSPSFGMLHGALFYTLGTMHRHVMYHPPPRLLLLCNAPSIFVPVRRCLQCAHSSLGQKAL